MIQSWGLHVLYLHVFLYGPMLTHAILSVLHCYCHGKPHVSVQPAILIVISALQNNRICSLKGSLTYFHFLETLDLSSNQLRNLPKLAANLAKFHFLSFLNLKVAFCKLALPSLSA